MTRDIIDLNDFTILVEEAKSEQISIDVCGFDEPVIAIAFYGEGNVDLKVVFGDNERHYQHTKGMALSFYADQNVEFVHTVSAGRPLACLVIATSVRALQNLPNHEGEIFKEQLGELINPKESFLAGPKLYMDSFILEIVKQFFELEYEGKTKMMFFRSQATALLSHFFGQLALSKKNQLSNEERSRLDLAKNILSERLDNPPSLNELSKEIGLNTHKLKKEFKEYFGLPVFKYLQKERLSKAHELLKSSNVSVQETAWEVGYESLSSFSNAFEKHFGYRPSHLK